MPPVPRKTDLGMVTVEYLSADNILSITHPKPLLLSHRSEIMRYFKSIQGYWKDHCRNEKVYGLVCLDNIRIDPASTTDYAECLAAVLAGIFITVARYGGDALQRTTVRAAGIKLHVPSRIYGNREEALIVLRGLAAGTMQVDKGPPPG